MSCGATAAHLVLVQRIEVRILAGQQKISSNVRDTSYALGARTLEVRILLPQPINNTTLGDGEIGRRALETDPNNFL